MPDALDRILTIGSTPDWISPAWAIVQDIINGPRHDFFVDLYAGWSVNDIKRLLRKHKVKVWGDMIADDMIVFSVLQKQARWAQIVLMRNEIPIISGEIEGVGVAKPKSKNEIDSFFDWMFKE